MKNNIKLGILGLGTVGGGVVNVLAKNKTEINRRTGANIEVIIGCVKDKNEPRICNDNDFGILTENALDVINSDADIVLELIGGTTLARDLTIQALNSGKHVITANKALIATYGNELLQIAKNNQVKLLFEAAVAGGIPILKSIEQGLSANSIEMIVGIINGTGNFILTEMRDKGRNFSDVLAEAQALGYAEADPTFDVEGIDAAHKLAILASMAFGINLAFDKITTIGIGKITPIDIGFAARLGYSIKHLAIAKKYNGKVQMSVAPTLIPKLKLLGNVDGVMNAVLIRSNALGDSLYYGAGAGSDATASSVIADVVDIVRTCCCDGILGWQQLIEGDFTSDIISEFYLRLKVSDKAGVLANLTQILANFEISIEQVVQDANNGIATIAIITNSITATQLELAMTKIQQQDFIKEEINIIHTENL